MNDRIERVIKSLEKNNINAVFVDKKEDIVPLVKSMLFKDAVITNGGSMSVIESGVDKLIENGDYNYFNRFREGITPEEQLEVYKKVLESDFYFCSTNALTENGELVNVDGNCNRISAISFGPRKVIMIVGINKIVKDVDEGFLRVKKIAAPKNCVRLGVKSPCSVLGHCVSLEKSDNPDITDGCDTAGRICCTYQVTGRQRVNGRITVVICGESLGY